MDVKTSLVSSFEEVLDKMAFLFFEEGEGDEEDEEPSFDFVTYVEFQGVISGCLNILVSAPTAHQIARNLIGIRDEDALHEGTLEDALREFTNLVMGRTMTLLNPDGPFDMRIPELVQAPAPEETGRQVLALAGVLEEQPFRMLLQYRETLN
jgi:CheY-specific phosphatase CheX